MNIADVLTPFRAQESPASILAMRDNPAVLAVVLAWRRVGVETSLTASWTKRAPTWDEVWDRCGWDGDALTEATGLDEDEIEQAVGIARAHRLIYPDGTISDGARNYLDLTAALELSEMSERARSAQRGPKLEQKMAALEKQIAGLIAAVKGSTK